jgi:hypothetical protein
VRRFLEGADYERHNEQKKARAPTAVKLRAPERESAWHTVGFERVESPVSNHEFGFATHRAATWRPISRGATCLFLLFVPFVFQAFTNPSSAPDDRPMHP